MKDYTAEEMEQMRYKLNGESPMDRIKRKSREEPFVPAGKIFSMKLYLKPISMLYLIQVLL